MYKTGLAIITRGLSENNLQIILKHAKNYIDNLLYVSIKGFSPFNGDWRTNIKSCYYMANKICPELDVRLLLPYKSDFVKNRDISVILCDNINLNEESIKQYASYVTNQVPDIVLNINGEGESINETPKLVESNYLSVVLGGTFDRLHNGHKILLSISALLTHEKLFCGVSGQDLIQKKFLGDLIEPLNVRINNCTSFLNDIKPTINYTVLPITEPVGPTVDEPDFDCIVASKETENGCKQINDFRLKKGFQPLNLELIEIVDEDSDKELVEILSETKLSSTKNRIKLLGKLLKAPLKSKTKDKPYIIGLTGGIASGKSSIGTKLKGFGAEIIDCDKLGHQAYVPGTECFKKLVSAFGQMIVDNKSGMINRSILGSIVFQNSTEMKKLTDIVWPAIAELAIEQIDSIYQRRKQEKVNDECIIIIDAAVLLDAGWQNLCNEVWVSFIPRPEAIERLKNRNNLDENDAAKRIDSQKLNEFYIESANVVFCTLWSHDFTYRQLKIAWGALLDRLYKM